MPRGGRRPGAGRKSNAELQTVRNILDQVISQDRWEQLFQTLYAHARKGNMRAAEILISYRYGDANAQAASKEDVQQIQWIEFIRPTNPASNPVAKEN